MHDIQKKLLDYIDNHDTADKTLRQIAIEIGEKEQPQKIKHHLDQLVKKGLLGSSEGSYHLVRPYELSDENQNLVPIPILGVANCGPAEYIAEQNLEGFIKVSRSLLPKSHKLFAMKASGSSMNQASIKSSSINDGDYVIVDPDDMEIENGCYVLSVIDGLANIKRFHRDLENNEIVLYSESTHDIPPIVIDPSDVSYMVNGKIIKVIKQLA